MKPHLYIVIVKSIKSLPKMIEITSSTTDAILWFSHDFLSSDICLLTSDHDIDQVTSPHRFGSCALAAKASKASFSFPNIVLSPWPGNT